MIGLLLKDWYVALKTCRLQLGVIVVMTAVSMLLDVGMAYLIYPILFSGMIPVYVLSVEEKNDWPRFAQALPVTRREVVTEKYLAALICTAGTIAFMFAAWMIRFAIAGGSFPYYGKLAALLLCVGLLFPALNLPVMLRLGVEKGRFVSIVVLLLFFAALFALDRPAAIPAQDSVANSVFLITQYGSVIPAAAAAAVLLFVLSWLLAVRLYETREL